MQTVLNWWFVCNSIQTKQNEMKWKKNKSIHKNEDKKEMKSQCIKLPRLYCAQ